MGLNPGSIVPDEVPISDAMRIFAASQPEADRRRLMELLANAWGERMTQRGIGQLLTLLWDGVLSFFRGRSGPICECANPL